MNPNEPSQPGLDLGGKQLCRSCTIPNETNAHFCVKCGAPLSSYATMGPWETILAQGFIYREAAERPRRFIVVLGIWLIFLPQAFGGSAFILVGSSIFGELIAGVLVFISVGIIGRTTWNYFSTKLANDRLQTPQNNET